METPDSDSVQFVADDDGDRLREDIILPNRAPETQEYLSKTEKKRGATATRDWWREEEVLRANCELQAMQEHLDTSGMEREATRDWWREEELIYANRALQEIQEYLSKAEKKRAATRDDTKWDEITDWIDEAQMLAYFLEDKIDTLMLPHASTFRGVNLRLFPWTVTRPLRSAYRTTSSALFQHLCFSQSRASSLEKLVKVVQMRLQRELFSETSRFLENVSYIGNSLPISVDMVGMEGDVAVIEQLLGETAERSLIFITGEGGSGKTTLAQRVYSANKHKFECQSWVYVYRSREQEVLKGVLEGFHISFSDEYQGLRKSEMSLHELREEIRKFCQGRSYLLVFDDVRDLNAWNWIKRLLPARTECSGKIIFTVRNEELLEQIDEEPKRHKLGKLSEADARKLLQRVALPHIDFVELKEAIVKVGDGNLIKEVFDECHQNELAQGILWRLIILSTESSSMQILDQLKLKTNEMMKIESDILSKCNGNPLAIRATGGLLRSKHVMPEAWQEVLRGLDDTLNEWRDGILSDRRDDIQQSTPADPFVLSGYTDLPPYLQFCFLYCGSFPDSENFEIPRKKLIRLWLAEGFVQEVPGKSEEEAADQQLAQLINREMLHVAKRGLNGEVLSCQILGPVRRIALSICQKQKFCEILPNNNINFNYCRLVSVHEDSSEVPKILHHAHRLRSLLFFGTGRVEHLFKHVMLLNKPLLFVNRYKLLRVLELLGIELGYLPDALECLVLLRYLGLRKTGLRMLPCSLQNLKYLKSLDIRDTYIVNIHDVHTLQALRHLHLSSSFRGRAVRISRGLVCLRDLRTLAGVAYTEVLHENLRPLIELRKLSVMNAYGGLVENNVKPSTSMLDRFLNYKTPDYCAKLCSSINRMMLLHSLTITCERDKIFDLSYLYDREWAPLDRLRTVKLGGQMIGLLDRLSRIQSIAYLYLWDSKLTDDPLRALHGLPKLTLLSLYNAYEGKNIQCSAVGYQKLKKLSIVSMEKLEKWERIERGAMPVLEKLFIGYCPKLSVPPEGLGELRSLQVVQIAQMPAEFEETIKKEELYMKCKVKCIPLHC